jgi:hypothetical protein
VTRGLCLAARARPCEAAYGGDFLEADLYEGWAVSLREEAHVAYVAVVRVRPNGRGPRTSTRARSACACAIAMPTTSAPTRPSSPVSPPPVARQARRAYCRSVIRMREIGVWAPWFSAGLSGTWPQCIAGGTRLCGEKTQGAPIYGISATRDGASRRLTHARRPESLLGEALDRKPPRRATVDFGASRAGAELGQEGAGTA